jgi:hypothetical protein
MNAKIAGPPATQATDGVDVCNRDNRVPNRGLLVHNLILETFDQLLDVTSASTPFEMVHAKFVSDGYFVGQRTKRELRVLYDMKFNHLKTCTS